MPVLGSVRGLTQVGVLVGLLVGLGGLLSVVLVYGKFGALNASMELFGLANTELRAQAEASKEAAAQLRLDFQAQMADERAKCAHELGQLQGQVGALTGSLGDRIAGAVIAALDKRAA